MRYASINDPTILLGYATHPGKSGKNNEDDYVIFEAAQAGDDGARPATMQVALVADGIGGNLAGETASHLTAQTFYDTFRALHQSPPRRRLLEALEAANQAVYDRALTDPNLQGMGTTVVAAALLENELFVAHAGDSRAYLVRQGRAHQLTADHTWAQEAIEAGRLTPEQAREHPNRHVIKRFLGIAPEVEVDTRIVDPPALPASATPTTSGRKLDGFPTQVGDTLLLCSDGLTDVVNDRQIEQTLKKYGMNLQDAAHHLVELANKAGGPDNITVLILQRRQGTAPVAMPSAGPSRPRSFWGVLVAAALLLLVGAAGFLLWRNLPGNGGLAGLSGAVATPVAAIVTAPVTPTITASPTATTTATPAPAQVTPITPTVTLLAIAPTPSADPLTAVTTTVSATLNALANAGAQQVTQTLVTDTLPSATPATMTPTPTATVAQATRPPTSTPVPELATDTPTPTPTALPTRTATPRAPQASALPPSPGGVGGLSVRLLAPNEGDTVDGSRIFAWEVVGSLSVGFSFEPAFWRNGQDPMLDGRGWGGITPGNQISIDLTKFPEMQPGVYQWGVRLVQVEPYRPLQLLSDRRTINFQPRSLSSSGSGGSNGSSGGGSGGSSGGDSD